MLIIFLILVTIVTSSCPSNCNCTSRTLSCSICLKSYFQIYNVTASDCQCQNGFQKFKGGGDFCCPLTCDKCYSRGCATCSLYATIVWNKDLRYFDCLC